MSRDPARFATTDGKPPHPEYSGDAAPAPQPINPETGQHRAYWVLSEAERAKGFVRPVRVAYVHAGVRPTYPLRDLTAEEREWDAGHSYVKYEPYPDEKSPALGRFWTQAELTSGCGSETRMALSIAETYARQPGFYGKTFCTHCRDHFLVEEFRWLDSEGRMTDEVLGS